MRQPWLILSILFLAAFACFLVWMHRPRVLFFFTEMDYSDNYSHSLTVPTPCLVKRVEIILSPMPEPNRGRAAVWVNCL